MVKSPARKFATLLLNGDVRAFCANNEQRSLLLAEGFADHEIYMDGRGGEDLAECIRWFRGAPGTIVIAADMRVFGKTHKALGGVLEKLERAKIGVHDIAHPEDVTFAQKLERARCAISNVRFTDDRRTARRHGRKGGTAKGVAAQARRDALMARDIVMRLCAHPKLTWKDRAQILGAGFSISSLQRQYTA